MALTQVQSGMLTGNNPAIPTTTAVGTQALNVNSGADNTAVGYVNLRKNTSGANNTGVGSQAFSENTTGSSNTAIGRSAMSENTTGSFNTAVGNGALVFNSTASNNTAVGYQAGYNNTTGTQNTFIGNYAGYTRTTGNYNTLIGMNAGYFGTTGSSNTFVGCGPTGNGAGQAVTTGSKNVIIGGFDGNQGGLDMRTANNVVVISDGDGNVRQWFDNGGALLMGTVSHISNERIMLAAGTSEGIRISNTGGGTKYPVNFTLDGAGVGYIYTTGSSTGYATSSDYRLKENIAPMTGALAKVSALKPCVYNWKKDGSDGEGFIAHELQAVMPNAVSGEKDAVDENGNPVYQGIDTSFLVATLTAAIQELKAEVDSLKAQLAK